MGYKILDSESRNWDIVISVIGIGISNIGIGMLELECRNWNIRIGILELELEYWN